MHSVPVHATAGGGAKCSLKKLFASSVPGPGSSPRSRMLRNSPMSWAPPKPTPPPPSPSPPPAPGESATPPLMQAAREDRRSGAAEAAAESERSEARAGRRARWPAVGPGVGVGRCGRMPGHRATAMPWASAAKFARRGAALRRLAGARGRLACFGRIPPAATSVS